MVERDDRSLLAHGFPHFRRGHVVLSAVPKLHRDLTVVTATNASRRHVKGAAAHLGQVIGDQGKVAKHQPSAGGIFPGGTP
jgi:hypothetical protein